MGQTLMSGDPSAFKHRDRETRKLTHVGMWTSLGAKPVTVLTETLHGSSTPGSRAPRHLDVH